MPSHDIKPQKSNTAEISILFTGFIAATYGFGVYLFSTVLPDMKNDLFFTYTEVGQIISLAQVGFLFAALTSGILAHKIGARRLILISMLACCLSLLGMVFVSQKWQIAILLTLAGAAAAAVWVPMVAVAQDAIPIKHQGKAIGLMSSGTAYGVFVNGLAIPILLPAYGWRAVWLFVFALSAIFLMWGWMRLSKLSPDQATTVPLPATVNHTNTQEKQSLPGLLRQPACAIILIIMFLNGIACMPTQNYLMSYLRDELGYSIIEAGRAWSTIGLIGMFGGFIMGALADKMGVQKSLTLTYVLLAIATGLFLHHGNPYEVYLGAAIFGLSFNAIFGLVPAFISLNFSKQTATLVFGFATVSLGVGSIVGNLFGGMVHDIAQSFSPIYQISIGMAFALAALSILLGRYSQFEKQ